ncbi:MAG: Fructokinase [Candidatus Carbobacillus altaicus]|uniref:fructokinase n=1 Tax=Candidatus Carbonibacillus altaicus TaxID=2163959 RepID=A0A2R6XZM2_9BACL|nr:MAG: Fructokinase [Candidatus Carbobacillus altaicus]
MDGAPIYAALEAGGTKMVFGVGRWDERGSTWHILERVTLPTQTPHETIPAISDFFAKQSYGTLQALGIASFGPLDLSPESAQFGSITTTPKRAWRHYPLKKVLEAHLGVPVAIDTDVAGAALGEARYGAGKGARHLAYMTVGTGIGVGIIINGAIARGLTHPEFGHIYVRTSPGDDFPGVCPYHGDCLEGLASGPAIEKRTGARGEALSSDHPVWDHVAYVLGEAVVTLLLSVGPEKVILGGGVMKQASLFPRIRRHVLASLNGYLVHPLLPERIDELIVPPGLGDLAGLYGALELARMYKNG